MNDKPAEVQRIVLEFFLIIELGYPDTAVEHLGQIVHLAHIRVQLRVDDMKCNKGSLVRMEPDTVFLFDHPEAVLAEMIFRGIVAHHGAAERILKFNSLFFALDGKADVVCQRDEQGLVERLLDLAFDVVDQILRQPQMLNRNLLYQFAQFFLLGLAFHAIGLFHQVGIDKLAGPALEAESLAGYDHLVALLIYRAEDIVVDYFFDPHFAVLLLFPQKK